MAERKSLLKPLMQIENLPLKKNETDFFYLEIVMKAINSAPS